MCAWPRLSIVPKESFPIDHADAAERPFEPFPESALDGSIADRFDAVARRFPSRLALSDATQRLTYLELARLIDRIAVAIAAAIIKRPGPVAIFHANDAFYAAATLGILAAGRGYVPMDAAYPVERNRLIATHAEVAAVVTSGDLVDQVRCLVPFSVPILDIAKVGCALDLESLRKPVPKDLADILYTSGSTGIPKGVYQNHRGRLRSVLQRTNTLHLGHDDRLALFHSPSTVDGARITMTALLNGASLHILPPTDWNLPALANEIRDRGITICHAVPTFFRQLARTLKEGERFNSVRIVHLSGERVDWNDLHLVERCCAPRALLAVALGSTESCGSYIQWYVDKKVARTSSQLPIGKDVEDFRVTIADTEGKSVQDGNVGEIVVSSPYIALGYWRDPELTARVFGVDAADPSLRILKTGDHGRRRPDGLLDFLGRKDHQIKLRGNRIELGEIETTIRQCENIRDAAVFARNNKEGEPRSLVAYVEAHSSDHDGETPVRLASFLAQRLPGYMVPATIIITGALPRLPNLKIDREALYRRDRQEHEHEAGAPPLTATEALLADIWAEVFELPEINRDDDFFELGGDSLAAEAISAGVHAALGLGLELGMFTDHPRLAALAGAIDAMTREAEATIIPPLVRVPRGHPLPLSLIQERIWRFSRTPEQSAGYTNTYAHCIRGPLDREMLRDCISYMARRHECLRANFDLVHGRPAQIIHPPAPVPLPFLDVSGRPDPAAEARILVGHAARQPVDLKQGPLIRFTLIRLSGAEHWLVHSVHHIISDEASRKIYFRELALLYDARMRGENPPLPDDAPLQYGDYAVWQREVLRPDAPRYQAAIAWWTDLFAQPAPTLELPFKRARPLPGLNPADGAARRSSSPRTLGRLTELARTQRSTYFVVSLAALVALLAAETGSTDIIVGSYVHNRNRDDLQNMIGCFVNLTSVRLRYEAPRSFREWLLMVRDRVLQTMAHTEVPYEILQQELGSRGVTAAEPSVILGIAPWHPQRFGGLDMKRVRLTASESHTVMPWGFTLHVHEEDARISSSFDASLYDRAGVCRFLDRYARLLDAIATYPDRPVEILLAE
jgi:amino acid adenylation domain-containing protein